VSFEIRKAGVGDAAEVAGVMNSVIAEGLTLFDTPFSHAAEREFNPSQGTRSMQN
jgi:hypothetical protein